MENKFEIALEALGRDGTDVSLEAFQKSLDGIGKFLRAIDENINGKPDVEWVVQDLHHSNPTIVLEGRGEFSQGVPEAILAAGFSSLEKLSKGEDDPQLSDSAIKALKSIVTPFGKSLRAIHLRSGETSKTLDLDFAATFSNIKFEADHFDEEWQGSLDEINFHTQKPTFRLYPLMVPRFITCEFDLSFKQMMTDALERKVMVFGEAIYRPNAKFPSKIKVKEIEVIDDCPNDLSSMVFKAASREQYHKQLDQLVEMRDDWG